MAGVHAVIDKYNNCGGQWVEISTKRRENWPTEEQWHQKVWDRGMSQNFSERKIVCWLRFLEKIVHREKASHDDVLLLRIGLLRQQPQ
jgi:hypothetical protein